MDPQVDTAKLVTYPPIGDIPHSELYYKVWSVIIGILWALSMSAAFMFSIATLMLVIYSIFIVSFDLTIKAFGIHGLVIIVLSAVAGSVLFFVLKAKYYENLKSLEYYHTGVPQGMVVGFTFAPDNGPRKYGVVVDGYTRQNQLRRFTQWVTASQWREYKEGQYVSFEESVSA